VANENTKRIRKKGSCIFDGCGVKKEEIIAVKKE
jgi:hypothetical protein